MKKIFFILSMLCIFTLSLCVYTTAVSEDLQKGLIRLHILARSDDEYDQKIKLCIRDEILKSVSDIPVTDTDKFLEAAQNSANQYLEQNNLPYSATAEYGTFMFPQKSYGSITLPAGKYKGVRVILDEGKGQNWWCVMYPPLCIANKNDKAQIVLKENLDKESYEVITKKPKVRIKVLELISRII